MLCFENCLFSRCASVNRCRRHCCASCCWCSTRSHFLCDVATFNYCFGNYSCHQFVRTNRVIIARNWVINNVWVHICVDHSNYWDAKFASFGNRDVLFESVKYENCIRTTTHRADARQVALQLLEFTTNQQCFFLWHEFKLACLTKALVLLHFADTL